MRIAIYGAGSLGTVLGAYISRNVEGSGLDLGDGVELYNRNVRHVQALNENGARITGNAGFVQKVRAFLPEQMKGQFDYIILMTKQLDNRATVEFLRPHLKPDGALCTMQNGLPEPDIADVLGRSRVLGCTIAWGATMGQPGCSTLTSKPDTLTFGLGAPYPEAAHHIPVLKPVLQLMGPVVVEDNFIGARWSKLLINASFSGMGTVIGGTFGDVCSNRRARRCAQAIIKECIDVTRAAGITISPVMGNDIVRLFDYHGTLKKAFSYALIPIAMRRHRGIRPGMLCDLEKGRLCEVDAIVGSVCREGDKAGVDTPVCDLMYRLIRGFEQGNGRPGVDNLSCFTSILN